MQNAEQAGRSDVLTRFEGALFRNVVDRLPIGIVCLDEDGGVRYVNEAAAVLMRKHAEGVEGKNVEEFIENAAVVSAVRSDQRSRLGAAIDHTEQHGEQELTLRFRVLSLSTDYGTGGSLITIDDISQLREGERARDNFLYHVTHELRTPLTNIHAYVETLTQPDFDDEVTRKECYNVIISETERLSRLVENILSISQLEVGTARMDVSDVDLVRLLRQMVQDNLGAADERRVDLTLTLPPKVPKLRGDKQRLSILLNNMIGNAVKYTPAEGKVHVSLEVADGRMSIAVSDTGIGIAEEDQARVFDKFYRATSDDVQSIAGTGLGLALAREVARLHGGDIRLDSRLGEGSTFTVELPLPSNQTTEVSAR